MAGSVACLRPYVLYPTMIRRVVEEEVHAVCARLNIGGISRDYGVLALLLRHAVCRGEVRCIRTNRSMCVHSVQQ